MNVEVCCDTHCRERQIKLPANLPVYYLCSKAGLWKFCSQLMRHLERKCLLISWWVCIKHHSETSTEVTYIVWEIEHIFKRSSISCLFLGMNMRGRLINVWKNSIEGQTIAHKKLNSIGNVYFITMRVKSGNMSFNIFFISWYLNKEQASFY